MSIMVGDCVGKKRNWQISENGFYSMDPLSGRIPNSAADSDRVVLGYTSVLSERSTIPFKSED